MLCVNYLPRFCISKLKIDSTVGVVKDSVSDAQHMLISAPEGHVITGNIEGRRSVEGDDFYSSQWNPLVHIAVSS